MAVVVARAAIRPRRPRRPTTGTPPGATAGTTQKQEKGQAIQFRRSGFCERLSRRLCDVSTSRNEYADAIAQLKALGHDDHPNVANLIGYSYRKLGDYKLSQAWYERALKADPNHVLTWQYYGLWQIEQGNREQAAVSFDAGSREICGTDCERSIARSPPRSAQAAGHRPRLLTAGSHDR